MRGKAERTEQDKAFDTAVGRRIRLARSAAGLNQTQLARDVGVTFQQIQKYEKGTNRVSASRMALIARSLGVTNAHLMGEGEPESGAMGQSLSQAAGLSRLIANYNRCGPEGQKAVRDLAASLAPTVRQRAA